MHREVAYRPGLERQPGREGEQQLRPVRVLRPGRAVVAHRREGTVRPAAAEAGEQVREVAPDAELGVPLGAVPGDRQRVERVPVRHAELRQRHRMAAAQPVPAVGGGAGPQRGQHPGRVRRGHHDHLPPVHRAAHRPARVPGDLRAPAHRLGDRTAGTLQQVDPDRVRQGQPECGGGAACPGRTAGLQQVEHRLPVACLCAGEPRRPLPVRPLLPGDPQRDRGVGEQPAVRGSEPAPGTGPYDKDRSRPVDRHREQAHRPVVQRRGDRVRAAVPHRPEVGGERRRYRPAGRQRVPGRVDEYRTAADEPGQPGEHPADAAGAVRVSYQRPQLAARIPHDPPPPILVGILLRPG